MRSLRTVTASTMITPIEIVGQGWTSQLLDVEKCRAAA